MLELVTDKDDVSKFSFHRCDGDQKSFYGSGAIAGGKVTISWRSTFEWLGHGSDESAAIDVDPETGRPIEIHWTRSMMNWLVCNDLAERDPGPANSTGRDKLRS